ncbi:MAG: S9 family peptidase [Myxococcota bacterium]
MTIPSAPKITHVHHDHGLERADNYHYLKDRNHPETIPYLERENAFCEESLKDTVELRKALYSEMLGRIQEDDQSAAVKIGSYWHYSRTEAGKAYRIVARRHGTMAAPEEIALDENIEAEGLEYYSAQFLCFNPSQTHIAWLEDRDGGERFVLRVRDLSTGKEDHHSVTDLKWSLAWGDDHTLFYVRSDHAQRPCAIWKRTIFTPPETDVLVWSDPDERFFMGVGRSRNGQYVLLSSHSKRTSEVRSLSTSDLDAKPRAVRPRKEGVEYSVEVGTNGFFVRINESAQNFKLLHLSQSGEQTVLLPNRADVLLYGISAFAKHVVVYERFNGLPRVRFYNLDSQQWCDAQYPDPVYNISKDRNPNFETDNFRLSFTSPTRPQSILSYDLNTGQYDTLKVYPVLGGFDPEAYACERIWAEADDGTKVPVTLAYRKGRGDGPHPTLMYGYGSYGFSYPVDFRSSWLSLLDRGLTLAIAHIRGGSEMGRQWYLNGKFFDKKNTFTDFISASEHLISEGWTSPSLLSITGGSAGGLLMGAVTNLRPALFKACVARVPFVDVVNTMMDDQLPLTVTEYEEWGDPNERQVFDYMLSYSPYDNIKAQAYPAMMITGGLNDPRVGYWEPAKWAAKLRELKTDDNLLILKTHMGAGHGGASGRYGYLDDLSWIFAFVLRELQVHAK